MVAFGPWKPYTQTLPVNAFGNVVHFNETLLVVNGEIYGTLPPLAVYDDGNARSCCMAHVLQGNPMVYAGWIGGASSCPTTGPGLSSGPIYGPGVFWANDRDFTSAAYSVSGAMAYLSMRANLTPSPFHPALPLWSDPDARDTTDPPSSTIVGSRVIVHEYQPFTAITVDIEMAAPTIVTTGHAHQIRMKRYTFGSTPWEPIGGSGAQVATMSLDTAGAATWSGSDHVPDATVGAAWSLTSSALQAGHFPGDDPGLPWGSGIGAAAAYASPSYRITVTRTCLRRSTGVAPPLHQRQRTDGLGGGPMHQSPGLASRQLGSRARGIY